jgi:hypothetical protein
VVRQPHQIHSLGPTRTRYYAITTTLALLGIGIGPFSAKVRIIFHLVCPILTSLHTHITAAAILRTVCCNETAACDSLHESATTAHMAVTYELAHISLVNHKVYDRIFIKLSYNL